MLWTLFKVSFAFSLSEVFVKLSVPVPGIIAGIGSAPDPWHFCPHGPWVLVGKGKRRSEKENIESEYAKEENKLWNCGADWGISSDAVVRNNLVLR